MTPAGSHVQHEFGAGGLWLTGERDTEDIVGDLLLHAVDDDDDSDEVDRSGVWAVSLSQL